MRNSIATLAIAVFAGLTLANTGCKQQPNSSPNPSGNPINTPGRATQVPVGASYNITWQVRSVLAFSLFQANGYQPTTSGTVSIVLLRGPADLAEPFDCIVDNAPNTGTYSWTPPTSLENDNSRYGIKIIADGTGDYQYSTQFGISNPQKKVDSASSDSTSTTTVQAKNTVSVYHTTYLSATGTAPQSTQNPEQKSAPKSNFSHAIAPTIFSNYTAKPTYYRSHASLPVIVSANQNRTATYELAPSKPITKPSSLGPVLTSVAIASPPAPAAPTVTATESTTGTESSPIAQTAAAVRIAAGGMLAGLGALAVLAL
ncbi:MAG: hypothetical protein Q9217_006187 [Psora testacea]